MNEFENIGRTAQKMKKDYDVVLTSYKIIREGYVPSNEEYKDIIENLIEQEEYEICEKIKNKVGNLYKD